MVQFIHTADWQIGKPYSRVQDDEKRALLRRQRIETIRSIGELVRDHDAQFVLVAGDLFDTDSPTKADVSATCSAIGSLQVPVYVMPGNHDYAGPGSIWEQEFFLRQQQDKAQNLHVLTRCEPVILDSAVLLP